MGSCTLYLSNRTSVKTPSCCRIPQRTCQDLGDPGKLSSQDIATGIQQHGIHTHMQTQNLWDKNWWKNGNQTSAPVSLKNSYSSTKIWIWKLLLDFILGHSPKLYIQSIQQGYDLHAACQQTRGRYAQCAIVKSLTGKTLQHVGHLVNLITPHRAELHGVGCHIDLLSNASNGSVVIRKTQVCRCSDCSVGSLV